MAVVRLCGILWQDDMSRHVTFMTIDEAEHYSPGEREAIVAAYPAHEREARARGIPVLGSGRIFPVAEELIACEPFRLPRYWPRLGALDFGWDHPSAAVELAWDTEADVVYVTNANPCASPRRAIFRCTDSRRSTAWRPRLATGSWSRTRATQGAMASTPPAKASGIGQPMHELRARCRRARRFTCRPAPLVRPRSSHFKPTVL